MFSAKRKTFLRYHEPGHFHELTFSCYRRRQLLTTDTGRAKLAEIQDAANQAEQMDLVAFVFMQEHVHLLVFPRQEEPDVPRYLGGIKQPFSRWVKQRLIELNSPLLQELTIRERPGKTCFRLWQEGPGYDRNLYSRQAIEAAVEYIHLNPVRRGLCPRAIDWRWSSARYYLNDPPCQQEDLPTIHGLPLGSLQ